MNNGTESRTVCIISQTGKDAVMGTGTLNIRAANRIEFMNDSWEKARRQEFKQKEEASCHSCNHCARNRGKYRHEGSGKRSQEEERSWGPCMFRWPFCWDWWRKRRWMLQPVVRDTGSWDWGHQDQGSTICLAWRQCKQSLAWYFQPCGVHMP